MCQVNIQCFFYPLRYKASLKCSHHRAYCIMLFCLFVTRSVCYDGGNRHRPKKSSSASNPASSTLAPTDADELFLDCFFPGIY
jgi:hypothetical protein